MARKSSTPKRKRASLPIDASQTQQDDTEADVDENPRPRKRGRPRKSINVEDQIAEPPKPKKRGRPSLGEKPAEQTKKKRGRPAAGDQQSHEDSNDRATERNVSGEEDAPQPSAPQRRGRKKNPRVSAAPQPDEEHQEPPEKRKRGRPSLKKTVTPDINTPPPEATKRKRGRPSLKEAAPPDTNTQTPEATKRRRGRPSLKEAVPPDINAQAPGASKGKAKETSGVRRESIQPDEETSEPDEEISEPDEEISEPASTCRRRSSQESLLIDDAPPKSKSLPHVASRTQWIKRSVVAAKWAPLSATSISAATETLMLAYRPIMQRMSKSQARRRHASSALSYLHRRISRHLQRGAPFPPPTVAPTAGRGRRKAGHEVELDFESVLDGTAAMDGQLDSALHAVELLEREKVRMQGELEKDYQTLRNLEAGAKGETRQRRERLRKMHVLAPEKRVERDEEDVVFEKRIGAPPGAVFKNLEEGELKDLALQLRGHTDSIKSNLQQAEGLAPQLASSDASLRSVLSKHLNVEQYEKVVFG